MATDLDLSTSFIPSLHKPSSLLPIARHRQNLLYLIESRPVTIVVGQTGSGKTTQIPQFLEQAGWCEDGKVVAVTQVGKFVSTMQRSAFSVTDSLSIAAKSGCHNSCHQGSRGDEM